MNRTLLYFLLLVGVCSYGQSQVDSLRTVFENTTVDTTKIKILHHLFLLQKYSEVEEAREVVLKAISLSERSNNLQLLAKSYNQYGEFLRTQSKYDSAIVEFNKGLKIAREEGYNKDISEALSALGDIHLRKGDHERSIKLHQENVELSGRTNDDFGLASSYNNLGNLYMVLGDYTKAMENFTLASKYFVKADKPRDHAISLANMGMVLQEIENYERAKDYFFRSDSVFVAMDFQVGHAFVLKNLSEIYRATGEIERAIEYSEKALATYKELGNLDRMGNVYYSLGSIAWEQDRFEDALGYYQKKLAVTEQVNDSLEISIALKAIGDCYLKLNQKGKAKANYLRALQLAELSNYDPGIMDAHEALADLYGEEGNFERAYRSEQQFGILKDSLYNKEKRDLANEIEAKFENEKKVKEISLLAKENDLQELKLEQQRNTRNAIIIFALVLLVIAGLLFNQFRIKQKANKKLLEMDRIKSNFFANISHEFRTPLTLIKGPIEHLEQNPDEQLSRENIKMIRRNSNRVLNLVNQLLDLSKIDDGNLKFEPTEGNIFKTLRAATSSFNSHAAQRDIDYKVEIPTKSLWTSFDRDKLEKVVYNLLSNAFKFSEDGSVISVRAIDESDRISIHISDTGKGIPDEHLPFIFDRFYQVDSSSSREHEGSGIGLSLSKDLVELMDGTITVSSELNKGTFFTVQLPLQEIKTRVNAKDGSKSEISDILVKETFELSEEDRRDVPCILLVEDNTDMRQFIREQLLNEYRINEAINGKAGLNQAVSNPPDLIITDLMMPKMDGIELCRQLKTNLNTSHIPVIMLTAKAGLENKIEGLETGADAYLTKPFNAKELEVRVKKLIEQRQKLRELFASNGAQIDPNKVTVTSVDQKFLEQLLKLLEEKYSESDFGVPQMQDAMAMSKTQLHRKSKALTNEAPGELLRNFRLKRAAQLLSQDADNVTQIAYSVGFNNLSYFAKCFKELYGVTPSSYSV